MCLSGREIRQLPALRAIPTDVNVCKPRPFLMGALGFLVFVASAIFSIGFSVFGFGVCCALQFLSYFAHSFQFLAKTKSGFRICYSTLFGIFPLSLCTSTTSTACKSSLILLMVFSFDQNLSQFCGFLLFFVFSNILQLPLICIGRTHSLCYCFKFPFSLTGCINKDLVVWQIINTKYSYTLPGNFLEKHAQI